ncbi:myosin phosphatase Rho-interacting protein-like [Synchiropus splendidus]|uniref:myosin phosphatase Rho-interacting protein-like n=1 Tax=Synchiropus splendidus TaxID=270530 RepID=UPI00237E4D3F|nr:myosin phosphatase Rho-interacting protein-like [Synchiropus splendidus]
MKGWMSRLDEQGKWRKHWFVLTHTWLRYFRDADAEESDDPEGEIDLTSCVTVSDCDVEKNYGLQIHTKRTVFTLSAMTSRIRRNWVKLLQQAIRDNTYQSESSSEKENPLSQGSSPCQPPAGFTCTDSGSERTRASAAGARSHQAENQSADADLDLSPSTQREEGEGWDRDQAKRLEERNRWFEDGVAFSEMGSRWDSMELKKGSVPVPVIETMDSEVTRKWNEFESLSFRDVSAQTLIGAQTYQSCVSQESFINSRPEELVTGEKTNHVSSKDTLPSLKGFETAQPNKGLQEEGLSLGEQPQSIRRDVVTEVDSPCGPGAPCRAKLKAMVEAHQKAVRELQDKHAQEIKALEEARDKMLQEGSHAAAKAVESLKAAHRAELEREVEKARRLAGGSAHVGTTYASHWPHADPLHKELDGLSEQYSQKCLELSRTEESSRSRGMELGMKDRELQQLRRENQELKTKLAEEITRMRYFITGQRSEVGSRGNTHRSAADIETLIQVKENEVQSLKREISCLQSEVQSLTKDKEAAYERYKEAYVELSDQKGRSRLELDSLKQHLSLTNAALQEQTRHT